MTFTIVLPTYNEAENIIAMIESIRRECGPEVRIIVADDSSPDGTFEKAETLCKTDSNLSVILRKENPGLSPSVICGFDAAGTDWLVCMDADGQHRPEDLRKMMDFAEKDPADMIIGSRHVTGGGFTEKWNFFRVLCSSTAALAAHIVPGVRVHDPMSGFFMIRRERYQRIRPYADPSGFKIMLELLCLTVLDPKARVYEFPITFAMRKHGQSKLGPKVITQYLFMLCRCFVRQFKLRKEFC